jgi:TRAP-type C4-dicarboxylate transport system permease small subunit
MTRVVTRAVDTIDKFFDLLTVSVGIVVVLTVAIISYGVLSREVLHMSDVWVTESTTYLMGYMTFVGGAALAWQGRHLKVDVLQHFLGPRARYALGVVSCVIVTAVAMTLCWLGFTFWWDAWTSGEKSWGMLSIPLWIPYFSLFAGSVLLVFAQLVRLLLLSGRPHRDPPTDVPRQPEVA